MPTNTDVATLKTLEDVMELQEAIAEPQFEKSDKSSFDDADWSAFTDASTRLQATSLKIKDFTRSPEFDALAMQLHAQAAELGRAASTKNAKATSQTLKAMHATCDGCHKKFR